jgi:hypothetical protein
MRSPREALTILALTFAARLNVTLELKSEELRKVRGVAGT